MCHLYSDFIVGWWILYVAGGEHSDGGMGIVIKS